MKGKCEWNRRKIPRVCPLGNLGNNPHSESSTEVVSSAATVKANDTWNTSVAPYFEILTGNFCVKKKNIMKTVWCFPKTLPVSLVCVLITGKILLSLPFKHNLMNTLLNSSKWIHEFLTITTSHSQGTNIRCIIARIAAGLLYYINALVGHVQSSFVLDITALSQSTKLRSKTRLQCNYVPPFVATWPLYQTKGLLFIIMSNMKTY